MERFRSASQPRSLTDWLQLRLARTNKLLADDNKRFQKVAPILPPNPRLTPNATGHVSGGLTSSAPEELSNHTLRGHLNAPDTLGGSELARTPCHLAEENKTLAGANKHNAV